MKAYLAAAFGRQAEIRSYRDQLIAIGHEVTSRWLDAPDLPLGAGDDQSGASQAFTDFSDIEAADTVISFTDGALARGGRHVEYGMAVAWGKRRVIVGPLEHVFHYLPGAICVGTPEALMKWATGMASFERDVKACASETAITAGINEEMPQ